MKRRVMQLLFAIGLLLTLAAGALWLRSFWASDQFRVARTWVGDDSAPMRETLFLYTNCFNFQIGWLREEVGPYSAMFAASRWHATHDSDFPVQFALRREYSDSLSEQLGFAYWGERRRARPWETEFNVCAPGWFLVLACAAFTAWLATSLWRSRKRALREHRGLCPTCGYDLRGAAHERCPECGAGVEVARV